MGSELKAGLLALMLFASVVAHAQGVAWDELSPAEQALLADQESSWAELGPERKETIVLGARRWLEMDRHERSAGNDRFTGRQGLGDDHRAMIRDR